MDNRQQFKVAFINMAIDRGLTTPAEITQLVKSALLGFDPNKLWDTASNIGILGSAAALAAPPIIGAVGGQLAGRVMNSADDYDVDEAKRQELIAELRRQSQNLRASRVAAPASLPMHRRR